MKLTYIPVFFFSVIFIFSQEAIIGQSIHLPKSIIFEKTNDDQIITHYEVQPKNTLYSICKAYSNTVQDLEVLNPGKEVIFLNPGDTLSLIFQPEIIDLLNRNTNDKGYIPIYYKTSLKDNLFRIARIYFDQNLNALMERNHLNTFDLQPGQLILIGWKKIFEGETYSSNIHPAEVEIEKEIEEKEADTIVPTKTPATKQINAPSLKEIPAETPEETEVKSETIDSKINVKSDIDSLDIVKEEVKPVEYGQQNGLAIWNKNSNASGIFALHSEAKAGTLIEVTNPQLSRKAFVKVIGKIPGNSYPDNVKLILSPEAARLLGALDVRFYVKLNYIKG